MNQEKSIIKPVKILDFYPLRCIEGFFDDVENKIHQIENEKFELAKAHRNRLTFEQIKSFSDRLEPLQKAQEIKNKIIWKLYLNGEGIPYIILSLGFSISANLTRGTISDCKDLSDCEMAEFNGHQKPFPAMPIDALKHILSKIDSNNEYSLPDDRRRLSEYLIADKAWDFIMENISLISAEAIRSVEKALIESSSLLNEKANSINLLRESIKSNKDLILKAEEDLINTWRPSADPKGITESKRLSEYLKGLKRELKRDEAMLDEALESFQIVLEAVI